MHGEDPKVTGGTRRSPRRVAGGWVGTWPYIKLTGISFPFFRKIDEDLKMIGVSSIDSLFSKVKIDEKGAGEESTLS